MTPTNKLKGINKSANRNEILLTNNQKKIRKKGSLTKQKEKNIFVPHG